MSHTRTRPPRLLGFVWFFAAAGTLAGGFLLKAMGPADAMGLDEGLVMAVASILCAFMVGQGVGELRGLSYARSLREDANSAT